MNSEKPTGAEMSITFDTRDEESELAAVRAKLESMGLIVVDEEPSTTTPTDRPDRVLVLSGGAMRHGKTAALVAALANSNAVDVQVYGSGSRSDDLVLTADMLDELKSEQGNRRRVMVVPKGTALHTALQRERMARGEHPTYQGPAPNRKQRRASATRGRKARP